MIKNNFFIPLMTIMLIGAALTLSSPNAFAHNDPNDPCNGVGAGTLIQVKQDGSTVTSATHGSTVQTAQTLFELPVLGDTIPCAFDGGTIASPSFTGSIVIGNPDGTTAAVNTGDIPCVGGTDNTGDLLLPEDCAAALASFVSNARDYVVDCNDEVDGVLNFNATFTGRSHHEADDSDDILKVDEITIDCEPPEYSFVTDADEQTAPYVDPTDQVIITGVEDFVGTWATNATLNGPDASLPLAAVCVTTPDTTDTFDLIVECTVTGTFTDPGDYCWDVTVEETTDAYTSSGDGTQTGTFENNECFNIPPENYTFVTTSSLTGLQAVGVSATDPEDLVTITGVEGVEGTFETSAVLTGPDVLLPLDAVCVTTPETTDMFDLEVTCTVLGTFSTAGVYCWDVTVNETGDNYFASDDGTQFGADDTSGNECFELQQEIGDGCTPGYWRNNLALNAPNWTNTPQDHHASFASVFGISVPQGDAAANNFDEGKHKGKGKSSIDTNPNLAEALWAQGGDWNALMRHAVAALLNAQTGTYAQDTAGVISDVQDAADGIQSVQAVKNQFDFDNNAGCGFDQQGNPIPEDEIERPE